MTTQHRELQDQLFPPDTQSTVGYPPLVERFFVWLSQISQAPLFVPMSLLAITVAGACLRLYKLGDWSFWGDEMFTVSGEEDGFNYSLLRKSLSLTLIQMFTASNGVNEWNARIIPALIGIASIPILFWVVKRMADTPTALLFSLLLALSPWHLYWSQNARFYVALLLFYSLALLFFYLGTEKDNLWYLVISLFFLGLAVKERLLALFFLPVALVYLLLIPILSFEKPRAWRFRNLAIFILPGLVGGFLFAGPYLLDLPGWFTGFGYANNNPLWLAGGFAYYVGLPIICLGGAGGLYLLMHKSRAGLLLSVSAVLPPLLLTAVSSFHYTANRYAFVSLTSWLLLSAVALSTLIRKTTRRGLVLSLGGLFVVLVSFTGDDAMYYFRQNGNRDDWRGAFAYVQEHQQIGDKVFSGNSQLADYYLAAETTPFNGIQVSELGPATGRSWFVEDATSVIRFSDLHAWLSENAQLVSIHDVYFQARNYSMRVYLYDPAWGFVTGRPDGSR